MLCSRLDIHSFFFYLHLLVATRLRSRNCPRLSSPSMVDSAEGCCSAEFLRRRGVVAGLEEGFSDRAKLGR